MFHRHGKHFQFNMRPVCVFLFFDGEELGGEHYGADAVIGVAEVSETVETSVVEVREVVEENPVVQVTELAVESDRGTSLT